MHLSDDGQWIADPDQSITNHIIFVAPISQLERSLPYVFDDGYYYDEWPLGIYGPNLRHIRPGDVPGDTLTWAEYHEKHRPVFVGLDKADSHVTHEELEAARNR